MKIFILYLIYSLFFSLAPNSIWGACMFKNFSQLKTKPSQSSGQSWAARKYMPLSIKKEHGKWIQVKDYKGLRHWIKKSFLTNKFKCAIVMSNHANARSGPGLNYNQTPISPLTKYTTGKVIDTKKMWVKLIDQNNKKFWVYRGLVWIN